MTARRGSFIPYFSDELLFCNLIVENPAKSPNTDGLDPESCRDVTICGVRFSLGDDCIAVKSGKIYMGRRYKTPSSNIHVYQCLMEHGHGAVTVGSEWRAALNNLIVENAGFTIPTAVCVSRRAGDAARMRFWTILSSGIL